MEFLKDSSFSQSADELERLMELELHKPVEEMDADLLQEYTRTWLEMHGRADETVALSETPPLPLPVAAESGSVAYVRKTGRKPAKRLLLLVAVLAVSIVLSMVWVSAGKLRIDVHSDFIQASKESVLVSFSQAELQADLKPPAETDIHKELASHGFRTVFLPSYLVENGFVKDIEYSLNSQVTSAVVSIEEGENTAAVRIMQYTNQDDMMPVEIVGEIQQVKELEIDNMPVIVVGLSSGSRIVYADATTVYDIYTSYDYKTALHIAAAIA